MDRQAQALDPNPEFVAALAEVALEYAALRADVLDLPSDQAPSPREAIRDVMLVLKAIELAKFEVPNPIVRAFG